MAFGILGSFDSSFPDRNNFKYLETSSDIFDMNCLEMANKSECQLFLSSTCVQNFLDNEWYGEGFSDSGYKTTLKVGFI
jgi:hypothetical protein